MCGAIAGMGLVMQSCTTALPVVQTAVKNNELLVPKSTFSLPTTHMVRVKNNALNDDVLLVKNGENYTALLMRCTHEGVGLRATDTKLICNAHGSQFDLKGNVIASPALRPLKKYKVTTNSNSIIIHLN